MKTNRPTKRIYVLLVDHRVRYVEATDKVEARTIFPGARILGSHALSNYLRNEKTLQEYWQKKLEQEGSDR